jgi:hypothetical protein
VKLLTVGNPKTMRGEAVGYRTYILHLAPARLSGYQVCPMASAGCAAACLNTAGRGRFDRTQAARARKTRWFFEDRDAFMSQLYLDIKAAETNAKNAGLIPVIRLNGTSDIRWETISKTRNPNLDGMTILEHFSHIQFYDYTKIANRGGWRFPKNYHLTFSRSESNAEDVELAIKKGQNVAVVFGGATLPATYMGRPVIDGTADDLRFLDPANVVVGLLAKGDGKKDQSGFVVNLEEEV